MPIYYSIAFAALFIIQGFTMTMFLRKEIPKQCFNSLIWKMLSSTVFVLTAVLAICCSKNHSVPAKIMLTGFCLSWLGDFLLSVKSGDKLFFVFGLFSFMTGHCFYIAAYTKAMMCYFPDAPFMGIAEMIAYVLFISAALYSLSLLKVEFGEAYLPCLIYMSVIGVMLVKAFSLAIRIISQNATENPVFTGITLMCGAIMFVFSDYTLSMLIFKKDIKKHGTLRNLNMGTYFYGQMLLALTLLYIIPA